MKNRYSGHTPEAISKRKILAHLANQDNVSKTRLMRLMDMDKDSLHLLLFDLMVDGLIEVQTEGSGPARKQRWWLTKEGWSEACAIEAENSF